MTKRRPNGDGMVRKRTDGRWEGRIVVGHWQDMRPIYKTVLARTQKELIEKLHRVMETYAGVELNEDRRMTLNQWMEQWLRTYAEPTLRPSTLEGYRIQIRFHDLRHTFATTALENGMDIKTLSLVIGHVSAATTIDVYSHITQPMLRSAARQIDRGIGGVEPGAAPEPEIGEAGSGDPSPAPKPRFEAQKGRIRKPGTGGVYRIGDRLWEGRYTPTHADGKRKAHTVYARTEAECEEKLAAMIREVKAQIKAEKRKDHAGG